MKYFLLIVLFASCKTSEQLYNKAKVKDLVKVAELARKDFPCTTTKIDSVTTVDTVYDLIEVPCDPVIQTRVDSFETIVVNTVKVKVPRQLTTIRIQHKVEDSAKIKTMYAEIQKAAALIIAERKVSEANKAEADKQREAKNKWRKWCLLTWGVIAGYIAFKVFRSKTGL
jgi:hypothetical protein